MTPPISELRDRIETRLAALGVDAWGAWPVERYLGFFDAMPEIGPYHHVPEAAQRFQAEITAQGGEAALEDYLRLAMLEGIARGQPPSDRLHADAIARIFADIADPRKGFHRHGNDLFSKDFAVCRGKLVPCGVELVDRRSGVGRRVLAGGGGRQLLSGLGFFARAGGFRPFYEVHFDRRLIGAFNADGYRRLYLRLAEMLAADPEARGVISSSWWHDPALARISPELGFIGRIPESHGARLLRVDASDVAIAGATRFAPLRTKLYREGAYRPQTYLLAWARRDVLAWAAGERVAGR